MVDFSRATELKDKLDSKRPLNADEIKKIRETEKIDQVYNSNALEGNTITKFETKMILEEGITISEKPMREHLEVVNLSEAIEYVEDLVRNKQPLSERLIKQIHTIVYDKLAIDRSNVGNYRRVPVEITGSEHIPPSPLIVPEEMEKLIEWSEENRESLHSVEYAALLHEKFVTIHPFVDGNGRTARLLMNFALTQSGYPDVVVKATPESKIRYNSALETAQIQEDTDPFIQLVNELVEDKLEKMLNRLEVAEEVEKKQQRDVSSKNFSGMKKVLTEEYLLDSDLVTVLNKKGFLDKNDKDFLLLNWIENGRIVGRNEIDLNNNSVRSEVNNGSEESSTKKVGFNIRNGNPKELMFFKDGLEMLSYMTINKNSLEDTWLISTEGTTSNVIEDYIHLAKKNFPDNKINRLYIADPENNISLPITLNDEKILQGAVVKDNKSWINLLKAVENNELDNSLDR